MQKSQQQNHHQHILQELPSRIVWGRDVSEGNCPAGYCPVLVCQCDTDCIAYVQFSDLACQRIEYRNVYFRPSVWALKKCDVGK